MSDKHFQNLFFSYLHHEPHFCLLMMFPETFLHFETFLYDLLHVHVLF